MPHYITVLIGMENASLISIPGSTCIRRTDGVYLSRRCHRTQHERQEDSNDFPDRVTSRKDEDEKPDSLSEARGVRVRCTT